MKELNSLFSIYGDRSRYSNKCWFSLMLRFVYCIRALKSYYWEHFFHVFFAVVSLEILGEKKPTAKDGLRGKRARSSDLHMRIFWNSDAEDGTRNGPKWNLQMREVRRYKVYTHAAWYQCNQWCDLCRTLCPKKYTVFPREPSTTAKVSME